MKKYYLDRKFDGFLNKLWIRKSLDSFLSTVNFENKTVLDLGCGEVPYKMLIEGRNITYYSCDLTFHQKNDIILDLNYPLPFKDAISDCIIMTEVLEHLPNPVFTLSEIHRILLPCGELFLTVPSFFRLHEIPNDFYRFTYYGLEFLLRKAGFRDLKIKGHGDDFTIFVQSLIFALRKMHLPKKILLFLIGAINSIFYFRDNKRPFSQCKNGNVIGLSATANK